MMPLSCHERSSAGGTLAVAAQYDAIMADEQRDTAAESVALRRLGEGPRAASVGDPTPLAPIATASSPSMPIGRPRLRSPPRHHLAARDKRGDTPARSAATPPRGIKVERREYTVQYPILVVVRGQFEERTQVLELRAQRAILLSSQLHRPPHPPSDNPPSSIDPAPRCHIDSVLDQPMRSRWGKGSVNLALSRLPRPSLSMSSRVAAVIVHTAQARRVSLYIAGTAAVGRAPSLRSRPSPVMAHSHPPMMRIRGS